MKKKYTIQDITLFFEQCKRLPEYYDLERVRGLINNPEVIARVKAKQNFTHLKFIVIKGTVITSLLVLFVLIVPHKVQTPATASNKAETVVKVISNNATVVSERILEAGHQNNTPTLESPIAEEDDFSMDTIMTIASSTMSNSDCNWPKDTLIDKRRLFVYLSDDELLKLGVFLTKRSLYYNNSGKKGKWVHLINAKVDTQRFTTYNFYLVYVSDTACTTYRWGHKFYKQRDVLVPVIARISNKLHILWFSSNTPFFNALPERYHYLQGIYRQLKCLRRRNPGRHIVNYNDPEKNAVLDTIPYLKLSKGELQNIGVGIFKDSIVLTDSSRIFRFKIGRNGGSFGTSGGRGKTIPEIPSMCPAMITDVKGLNQASFGRWAKKRRQKNNQYSSELFNTLIPVNLPVSDYVTNKKYSLILWYYPSAAFLNALPQRYKREITSEIEHIQSNKKTGQTSCTYFEACKSTLSLYDLKIFPNPASEEATLEFTLPTDVTGKVSLVNISGSELRLLVPKTRLLAGYIRYTLDLREVPPGIYLVSIITNKGFKTQRIIVSR